MSTTEEELFTTRVKKATRKIHSVSDALVNAKFAISLRDETVWGGGLFIFYHIFGFLEDAKERLNMPELNKLFVHKTLNRKKAFEADLAYYLGPNWQCTPKDPALESYIGYLQQLEKENPEMLLVYVYHLYLGLLSGGQILARKRKVFESKNSKDIYIDNVTDFHDIDIGQLKKDFRQAMNDIAEKMTEQQKLAFIEESNKLFILNNSIVSTVGGQNKFIKDVLVKVGLGLCVIFGVYSAYKMHNK